jgi:hypothetical protein
MRSTRICGIGDYRSTGNLQVRPLLYPQVCFKANNRCVATWILDVYRVVVEQMRVLCGM